MHSLILMIAMSAAPAPVDCLPGEQSSEQARIDATNLAVREAFARGDVEAIAELHHENVIKSLGPGQYYEGREALKAQLEETFAAVTLDFDDKGEALRESLTICGDTAVSITRFEIAWSPKDGSPGGVSKGRSMIVLVRSDDAPHGWVTLSEVIQPEP